MKKTNVYEVAYYGVGSIAYLVPVVADTAAAAITKVRASEAGVTVIEVKQLMGGVLL